MKLSNFLPLNRDILDHWVYQDKDYLRVWLHILLSAQFLEKENRILHNGYWITQNYGDFIFGRIAWSKKLGVSEQRLRTIMKKFEAEGMIEKSASNQRATLYSVANYSKFNRRVIQQSNQRDSPEQQPSSDVPTSEITTESTSDQPATNQRPTTINIVKKDNIVNNLDNIYSRDDESHDESYHESLLADVMEKAKKADSGPSPDDISFVKQVVDHLNKVTDSRYRPDTAKTKGYVLARRKEGYKLEDFVAVIDKKSAEWKGTDMAKYLRPETLFSPSKFENYLNQPAKQRAKTGGKRPAGFEERQYTEDFFDQFYEEI